MPAQSNKSLDRSAGSLFLNLFDPAKVGCNRRARSTQTFGTHALVNMRYTLFADYFQFYLQDELADGNLGDAWTEEAEKQLLALAPGTMGVGTVRNMDVPVDVEVQNCAPTNDVDQWDPHYGVRY